MHILIVCLVIVCIEVVWYSVHQSLYVLYVMYVLYVLYAGRKEGCTSARVPEFLQIMTSFYHQCNLCLVSISDLLLPMAQLVLS